MKRFRFFLGTYFLIVFSVTAQRISPLALGELLIYVQNLPPNTYMLLQSAKMGNTTHWNFQNNIVWNSDYTGQTIQANGGTGECLVGLYWRDGTTNGMGKGIYYIYAKTIDNVTLTYFIYDIRTSKSWTGSPDLKVNYDYALNKFYLRTTGIEITRQVVNAWDVTPGLIGEQETDKFEPQAPTGLFVYNNGGHPQLVWSNNYLEDYWTAIEVYRAETYSGPPSNLELYCYLKCEQYFLL